RRRPDRLEHRGPGEVLGGDQLDLAPLAVELALQRAGDLGVDVGEARRLEVLERLLRDRHWRHRSRAAAMARSMSPAPSRRTTGSGPLKSITVDGEPESGPASTSAAQASLIRAGTSSRLAAGGSPGSFALVAATRPTASRTVCVSRGTFATLTPIVSG